ncbi:MAG: dNTP triphosphohydrolase [Victivallaceae bacterium]|nr:dNTP triphosphohydrolase [Victivallaceae bacterium]
MQKAQVFSLEKNTSVRNRLTHSIEVSDIGKTIARQVGESLKKQELASESDIRCLESIVETACLIHDIGNPPFGHFGEEAVKRWFSKTGIKIFEKREEMLALEYKDERLFDLRNFDGNPQGFRIITRLHTELDRNSLNLTYSALLSSIKYPCYSKKTKQDGNFKKLGLFSSESDIYNRICDETGHIKGKRYFIVYLMELADDICYCLSDIADALEKKVIDSRLLKDKLKQIAIKENVEDLMKSFLPDKPIDSFSHQIGINISRTCIKEAVKYFVDNLDSFLNGEKGEIIDDIETGKILKCMKTFARRYISVTGECPVTFKIY